MKIFSLCFLFMFFLSITSYSQNEAAPYDVNGNGADKPVPIKSLIQGEKIGDTWTSVGPFGGDVLDIALDHLNPGYAYAAAGYPYMRASESEPWQLMNSLLNLSASGVHCIEANSMGTLYAGGNYTYGKIFISTDQGSTWSQKFTNVNAGLLTIAIDPGNEDILYVGTQSNISGSVNKVIVKSTDGGDTWTGLDMTDHFPIGMGCNAIAVDPDNSDVIVALGDGGFSYNPKVIITEDGGTSWEDITAGLPAGKPFNEVTIFDGTVYICGGQLFGGNTMGIYASFDYGQEWMDISIGFPVKVVNDILIDPLDPEQMYAATEGDGIYYSTNGGLTWTYATGGAGDNGSVRKIIFNPENSAELYAGFLSLGVCISNDNGLNWSSSTVGIASLKLNDIEIDPVDPGIVLASFEAENSGGCYLFNPDIDDWQLVTGLPATRFSAVSISNEGVMYAWSNGPTTVAPEGLYTSADGGETWDNLGPNIGPVFETQIYALALSQTNPDLIFIGGNNFGANGWASMIYRSSDAGESWENVYMGPDNDGFKYLFIDPASEDQIVYAAYKTETSGAGFIKSTDGGTNWMTINEGIPSSAKWAGAIICDAGNSEVLYGGVGGYGGTPGKVYRSENGGSLWEAMNINLTNYSKVSDLVQSPLNPEVIYAATTLNGVYMTQDGLNWAAANEGLPASNITGFSRLFENEEEKLGFYASSFSNSAFYTEVYEPGGVGIDDTSPGTDDFAIAPNPSDGNFVIQAGRYTGTGGTLSIYSISGNRIFTKYTGDLSEFSPAGSIDLQAGIYFVTFETQVEILTAKLIIQ